MSGVLDQDDLLRLTGLSQKAALKRHLKRGGIPFKEINGRILTTTDALTATMVGKNAKKKKQPNWGALDNAGE